MQVCRFVHYNINFKNIIYISFYKWSLTFGRQCMSGNVADVAAVYMRW